MKTLILFFILVSGKSKSSSGGGASATLKQSEEQNKSGDYSGANADLWNSVKLFWKQDKDIIIACVVG